jgi:GNAT superfamily N-acetyltransferase
MSENLSARKGFMKTEIAFEIDTQDYWAHQLLIEDIGAIRVLCDECLDFMMLIDGRPANPASVEEDFHDVPDGYSSDDKSVFGIIDRNNGLVGMLDVLRGYPEKSTWWIGLLMLAPQVRSSGIGKKVLEGFSEFVLADGCRTIMLGVVEENSRAIQFWSRMGFSLVRKSEPKEFGNKTHIVWVMRKELDVNSNDIGNSSGSV